MTKAATLRAVHGEMTKQHVVAAVEPTTGITPRAALDLAHAAPPPHRTRVYIEDYIPALDALVASGYTQKGAADYLVSIGVPFGSASMLTRFREFRRGARKRRGA